MADFEDSNFSEKSMATGFAFSAKMADFEDSKILIFRQKVRL